MPLDPTIHKFRKTNIGNKFVAKRTKLNRYEMYFATIFWALLSFIILLAVGIIFFKLFS